MRNSTTSRLLFAAIALAACGGTKDAAKTDTVPVAAPVAAAPKTPMDFVGVWKLSTMVTGQEKPVPSTLTGSADGNTWTLDLEGRKTIPVTVSMSGDSLIAVSGEYESVLRKGVTVTTRSALVLNNGALTGNLVATYILTKGMETATGTITGTKAP